MKIRLFNVNLFKYLIGDFDSFSVRCISYLFTLP